MTEYTGNWKPDAVAQSAEFYVFARQNGQDAGQIAKAVAEIDRALQRQPEAVGESRAGNQRVLIVAPLTVLFEAQPLNRRVDVLQARYHHRRS